MDQTGSSSVSPEAEWRRRLASGRLSFQRCQACCAAIYYPRTICIQCGSQDLVFCDSAGAGYIESFTTVAFPASHEAGSALTLVIVQLDEGIKLMTRLADKPEGDIIGKRVILEPKAASGEIFPSFHIET